MTFLAELKLYYSRKIKETLRNPAYLAMAVITPLLYMLLFAPLLKPLTGTASFGGQNVLNVFLPGMGVLIASYGGMYVGYGLIAEIREGIIERFRVTPTSRLAILLGAVLRDVTGVLVQVVLISLLAIPFGLQMHWDGFLIALILIAILTALFAAFSYALGLKLKSENAITPVLQAIGLPLMLLAGFLLPMSMAPRWLVIAAHFNPMYYAVEASRALMGGELAAPVVFQAFAVLIPLTALTFNWAIRCYRTVVS
jgi:ABC-2 type transport system permease protein